MPDFLASRLSGTLAEVEAVVDAEELATSQEAALEQVRPAAAPDAVTLVAGLRWLRRRLSAVRAALVAAVTLVPALSECRPTLTALVAHVGCPGSRPQARRPPEGASTCELGQQLGCPHRAVLAAWGGCALPASPKFRARPSGCARNGGRPSLSGA